MNRFKGLVDVCGGKMTLRKVCEEISFYVSRSPDRLIVDIQRKEGGYYTTFYLSKKNFKGGAK